MLFDEIFVVNMDRDTKRLEEFDSMMKKCQLSYTRFSAIDPKALTEEQEKLKRKYIKDESQSSTRGELGCTLSHFAIWQLVVERGYKRILIFEDDARTVNPGPHIFDSVNDFYQQLGDKEEPDLLYLGKCCDRCKKLKHVYENIYRSTSPLCTHAYIITNKGAKKLLSSGRFGISGDMEMAKLCSKGILNAMVFHPSLFFQEVLSNKSNLRDHNMALRNTVECYDIDMGDTTDWWIWIAVIGALFLIVLGLLLWKWR